MLSKIHWVGVFLLFASSVLLLITTISAPVIDRISLLRVNLGDGSDNSASVNFGTFGYCLVNGGSTFSSDSNSCTKSHIGYDPAAVMAQLDRTSFESIEGGTAASLTRVMVLHPIACGVAFIAFLLSCGAGTIGSFTGAMVAFLAWLLTLISLATDFTLFGIIHHHVNDNDSGSEADFGAGIWCLVAAFVTLFLGMFIVFFTCCAARREKRRTVRVEKESPPRRRGKRFGIF